jgi:ABC-type oligopeptide transport system substrate-binding subunit
MIQREAPMTDVVEARRLIAEAGFEGGRNFPGLSLGFLATDCGRIMADAIQDDWRTHLGISIRKEPMSLQEMQARVSRGDFDIVLYGLAGLTGRPEELLGAWLSNESSNFTGWSDANFDTRVLGSLDSGADSVHEAEQQILEAAPVIPVTFLKSATLVHPSVVNWPDNIARWYLPFKRVRLRAPGES